VTCHRQPSRREEGTLTLFTAIVAVGLLAAIVFVTDAAQKLAAAAQAQAVAAEAARAGADQVSASAAYAGAGPLVLDPAQAAAAARAYLAAAGTAGIVTVNAAGSVTVTVTITRQPMLGVLGVTRLSATQTATARLAQGGAGSQP
jgi:Flp pilus assembly protein TadG